MTSLDLPLPLDATERALQDEFRHFAVDVLRPYAAEADAAGDFPAALLARPEILTAMRAYVPIERGGGWRSLADPARVHDVAGSMRRRVLFNEEGGYGDAALFLALPGPALTEPIVRAFGRRDQQAHLFASFTRDEPRWSAFAMSEPDAGSDVGAIRTTARKRPDGGYVIDGRKWFIGNGARAEWVTVFANVAPDRGQFGLRIFVVHRGTPGFRVGRVLPTMGLKALQVSELVFEECGVPEDAVLEIAGRKGEAGIQAALKTFSCFRPAVAATAMGVARAAIDALEQLLRQNGARHTQARQWRAVAQRIDEMRAEVEAVRSLVWRAAARHDEGKGNEREASMAKVMGADVVLRICAEVMELAGAAGATDELPFERLFRDAVAFDMLEGTGDIHRLMVARALTRMGRS